MRSQIVNIRTTTIRRIDVHLLRIFGGQNCSSRAVLSNGPARRGPGPGPQASGPANSPCVIFHLLK